MLDEVDRLDLDARSRQSSCAELRVVLPHATYASYATVDFLQQMADSQQLRVHIRESGSMEALAIVIGSTSQVRTGRTTARATTNKYVQRASPGIYIRIAGFSLFNQSR